MTMCSFFLFMGLLIAYTISACTTEAKSPATPTIQGPAVTGNNVEIEAWEYLGADVVELLPLPADDVKVFGNEVYQGRLIRTADGFDLIWGQIRCANQPIVTIHADATIEFWPGGHDKIEGRVCESAEVFHKLSVKWNTDIPFEQWNLVFHSPPLNE